MPCYSPLRGYKDVSTGGIQFRKENAGPKMEVACGQCLGCRLDRSRDWAARIVHESEQHEQNCFITLTYRDQVECTPEQLKKGLHLPSDLSLHKTHFQKFLKKLRKRFPENKIRYFHCGEYGEENQRPHYHACMFGIDFNDSVLYQEREGIFLYSSTILDELWGYGFTTVGELTFDSAAYTARYVLKKVTGPLAHDYYLRNDLDGNLSYVEPEYCTMSRRPGIGKDYYHEFKQDFFPSDECPVPGKGVYAKVPRYYTGLLEKESPEELEMVKNRRLSHRKKHSEDYTARRLEDRYKVKKAQLSNLVRNL